MEEASSCGVEDDGGVPDGSFQEAPDFETRFIEGSLPLFSLLQRNKNSGTVRKSGASDERGIFKLKEADQGFKLTAGWAD